MMTNEDVKSELQQAKEEFISNLPLDIDIVDLMFYLCKLKEKADHTVFELYTEESKGQELMENNHTFIQLKNLLESVYEYKRKTESIKRFKETVLNER